MKMLWFTFFLATCFAKDWKSFKLNFNKIYTSPSEELKRLAAYEINKMWIEDHNKKYEKGQVTFKVEMNQFGDLTDEEFKKKYLNSWRNLNALNEMMELRSTVHSFKEPMEFNVPESLNWTKKGAVTPVKDQKLCGACWAFSAAGTIEAQIFKKTGKLIPLSEQHLLDCSREYGNKGCAGGMPYKALRYILKNGVQTEESYPYLGQEETCHYNGSNQGMKIKAFAYLKKIGNRENNLKIALARVGPISACIWASKSFRFFSGGIYSNEPECENNSYVNHAVLVVGYGHEESMDYWLIKNSWGIDWGEYGYAKMARNMNDHCNIASHNVFPII